jgi:hypothetical protein
MTHSLRAVIATVIIAIGQGDLIISYCNWTSVKTRELPCLSLILPNPICEKASVSPHSVYRFVKSTLLSCQSPRHKFTNSTSPNCLNLVIWKRSCWRFEPQFSLSSRTSFRSLPHGFTFHLCTILLCGRFKLSMIKHDGSIWVNIWDTSMKWYFFSIVGLRAVRQAIPSLW